MNYFKPNQRLLTLWRLRLAFAALPPAFLFALFSRFIGILWFCLFAVFVLGYLCAYRYYGVRYANTRYILEKDTVVCVGGVFADRNMSCEIGNIQYISVCRDPFERYLGLRTVNIYLAGGKLKIQGIEEKDAENIKNMILRKLCDD